MKILIADDDLHLGLILKKAIEKLNICESVKVVMNGVEAVDYYRANQVDVVFLDIDMPQIDGITAAKQIVEMDSKAIIIFVTAHNEFMSEAFELYAFDYIIKPFKLDRLEITMQKILLLYPPKTIQTETMSEMANEMLIKSKESLVRVDFKDVIMVLRENRNTVIITSNDRIASTKTLSEIEELLPKSEFIRCHKSYIIRIDKIHKITKYGRWTSLVKLHGTTEDALLTKEKECELESRFQFNL